MGRISSRSHNFYLFFFNLLQVLKKVDRPQRSGSKRSYVEVEEDDDINEDIEKKREFDSSGSQNC